MSYQFELNSTASCLALPSKRPYGIFISLGLNSGPYFLLCPIYDTSLYNFWNASRSKIGTEIQGWTALSYILKIPIQKRGKDQKWHSLCFLLWLAHLIISTDWSIFLKNFANLTTFLLNHWCIILCLESGILRWNLGFFPGFFQVFQLFHTYVIYQVRSKFTTWKSCFV